MGFKKLIGEVIVRDLDMDTDTFSNSDVPTTEIYKGKIYTLSMSANNKVLYVIKNDDIVYRMKVSYYNSKKLFMLYSREKLNQKEEFLTYRVIFTLLYLGYEVIDDYQYNNLGLKVLKKIISDGYIDVYINGKEITDIDDIVDDDLTHPTYVMKDRSDRFLLEGKPCTYTRWVGGCLFDDANDLVGKYLNDGKLLDDSEVL